MLVTFRKFLVPLALAAAVVITGSHRPVFAQAAAGSAQAPQKNWKDRAEYDLYESITKETTPAKRLELLNSWKQKYASSDFEDVRQQVFMATYAQMNRPADALKIAGEILATDPNNLQALSSALTSIFSIQNPTPDQLATSDKAANQVLSNADTLFAADKKPASVNVADWETAKKNLQQYAQNALGYVAWQRKDYAKAEAEFTKSLQMSPNQGQISYWLSNVILAQKATEKSSFALYEMARAAAYDGPGSLNAAGRQQVLDSFKKSYTTWHGSVDGADQVLAKAKDAALPPPDFKIMSKADLAKQQFQKEEQLKDTNPQLYLWKSIKDALTGASAQSYFDDHMKGTKLPEFKAKLLEARPDVTNAKELVVSVEDGVTPDATLTLSTPLKGKVEVGGDIGFQGTATSYAPTPYMVTFDVDPADITGLKVEAPPKKAPVRRAPARRKR